MEELKQRVDEYWGYAVQESWDLYWLRLWLELLVPTMLSSPNGEIPSQPQKEEDYRAWSLGESLPFSPSRTVEGISEGDLHFLCDVFDVAEKDRYTSWAGVFLSANTDYMENVEDGHYIVREIVNVYGKETPRKPALFLTLATCHSIDSCQENRTAEASALAREQRVLEAFAKKSKVQVSKAATSAIGTPTEFDIQDLVGPIHASIDSAVRDLAEIPEFFRKNLEGLVPGNLKQGNTPPLMYKAFYAVIDLLREELGKTNVRQMAADLFAIWSIEIDTEAAKRWKARNGDMD
jgi:hypothetical protein